MGIAEDEVVLEVVVVVDVVVVDEGAAGVTMVVEGSAVGVV